MKHCLVSNLFLCVFNEVPIQVQAKESRAGLATAVPTGPKAAKLPIAKIASKGKKQSATKKTDVNSGAENTGEKNEKTKPQVTHELSMVRPFLVLFL